MYVSMEDITKYIKDYPSLPVWYLGMIGRPVSQGHLVFTLLPSLRMRINLTPKGIELIEEWMENKGITKTIEMRPLNCAEIERDLLDYALCNGYTRDPDDDGRNFITDAGIDDDGQLDVKPGDLGWFWHRHAIDSWVEDLYDHGEVIFSAYYFGNVTLDGQRIIKI